MKINRISWENYRALDDGAITADGRDVAVSGTNGAGKSSIASVLPFILFGTGDKLIKRFDDGQTPTDDGLIHAAQVTFDNGMTLRREYAWSSNSNRHALYINGQSVTAQEFKTTIQTLTHGGGELVINPFTFGNLKAEEQRKILTRMFGLNEEQILDQFPEIKKLLGDLSADEFIARAKSELKKLKSAVEQIPARIDEQKRNLVDGDAHALTEKLSAAKTQRDKLKADSFSISAEQIRRRINELNGERTRKVRHLTEAQTQLQRLSKEWYKLRDSKPGKCPTCGQTIPLEKFNAARAERMTEIERDGKAYKADVADYKAQIAELDDELAQLRAQPQVDNSEQLAALDGQIESLTRELTLLQASQAARRRIEKLRADELELNKKITRLEGNIKAAQNFVLQKVQLIEDEIGGHFKRVKFKLFSVIVSTGEIKPTCEATLDGVPYSALSKGERLVAALDILKTLQNYYGVQMPLMIDDSEAYTPGKFTGLDNQKFFFRVDTGKLTIHYSDVKIAA